MRRRRAAADAFIRHARVHGRCHRRKPGARTARRVHGSVAGFSPRWARVHPVVSNLARGPIVKQQLKARKKDGATKHGADADAASGNVLRILTASVRPDLRKYAANPMARSTKLRARENLKAVLGTIRREGTQKTPPGVTTE